MKLALYQLQQQCQQALAPIYLISGNEPILLDSARTTINQAAKHNGFNERQIQFVDSGFSWDKLHTSSANLSLFSDKKILDIRLNQTLNAAGKQFVTDVCQQPLVDTIIMISGPKLDNAAQRQAWVKKIIDNGVFIPIWPLTSKQLPYWIKEQCQQRQLQLTPDAITDLIEHTEGNLLATQQTLEHCRLLYGSGKVDQQQLLAMINRDNRYDVFQLIDSALLQQSERCYQQFNTLKQEGIEASLLVWAIAREIRILLSLANGSNHYKIWDSRKPMYQRALKTLSKKTLQQLLIETQQLDAMVKGASLGNVWDQCLSILLTLSGKQICMS